jgi:hypothetical protein
METTTKKNNDKFPKILQTTIKGFTIGGTEIDIDSPVCYAKKYEMTNGRTTFYVKTNLRHIIIDPFNGEHTSNLERAARRTGNPSSSFRPISKNGFEAYIQYITTKNSVFYRRASRELLQ